MTAKKGRLARIRDSFHQKLCSEILGFRIKKDGTKSDVISVADKSSNPSRLIAKEMALSLGYDLCEEPPVGQSSGKIFGDLVEDYLRETFSYLDHVRPGDWTFSAAQTDISRFEQYDHLDALLQLARRNPELRTALDGDYLVKPDIIVYKKPLNDDFLNLREELVMEKDTVSKLTPLREGNTNQPTLHGSISCKWTMRSDRSQNSRTEALNLIRNRKGRVPHIVVVTMEPLPSRIASIAFGTGDLDCTYHAALPELQAAIHKLGYEDAEELLHVMIRGRRLRDISDLPLDLAI